MLPASLNVEYLMYIIYSCIKQERLCLTTFPNTEDSTKTTTHGRVFLMNFKVFVNEVKHGLECLKCPLKQSKT